METSTLNGANGTRAHGIVALSMNEIEMVAGGKASSTTTSAWDRFVVWLDNWINNLTTSSAPKAPTITAPSDAALVEMLKICRDSGGAWEYQASAGGGGVAVRLVRADGAVATLRVICD